MNEDESMKKITNFIIGVTGPRGAGKTTLCRLLKEEFASTMVSTENFYVDKDRTERIFTYGEFSDYDYPTSIRYSALHDVLRNLRNNRPAPYHPFSRITEHVSETKVTVYPSKMILSEGSFLMHKPYVDYLIELLLYLDLPLEEQIKRRKEKEDQNPKYAKDEYLERFVAHSYKKFIEPIKKRKKFPIPKIIDASKPLSQVVDEARRLIYNNLPTINHIVPTEKVDQFGILRSTN